MDQHYYDEEEQRQRKPRSKLVVGIVVGLLVGLGIGIAIGAGGDVGAPAAQPLGSVQLAIVIGAMILLIGFVAALKASRNAIGAGGPGPQSAALALILVGLLISLVLGLLVFLWMR